MDESIAEVRQRYRRLYKLELDDRAAKMLAGPHCQAGDEDCLWDECPQTRDGEPTMSGRSCPLWVADIKRGYHNER